VLRAGALALELVLQKVHVSKVGAVLLEAQNFPAGQSVQTELPSKEPFPVGQSKQSATCVAPEELRYLPQGHACRGAAYKCAAAGSEDSRRFNATGCVEPLQRRQQARSKTRNGQGLATSTNSK
jgi:hypothetical protein